MQMLTRELTLHILKETLSEHNGALVSNTDHDVDEEGEEVQ
jgi:hypothetical protein